MQNDPRQLGLAQVLLSHSSNLEGVQARQRVRSFAVAVGGYNKMHTRQTDGRTGEWAAQRLPDNLPAVRLGRRWASL